MKETLAEQNSLIAKSQEEVNEEYGDMYIVYYYDAFIFKNGYIYAIVIDIYGL